MPQQYKFAVCLTHDIDQVDGGWLEAGFHTLKRITRPLQSARGIAHLIADRMRGLDPYWNLEEIMALEERHCARSSFYFLPRTGHPQDARYDIRQERFRSLFKRMRDGGWEIGLHGSYESAYGEGLLADQRRALEDASGGSVTGVRQHFLRLPAEGGWRRQQEAGFQYDSTLGFAGGAGFRAGLARPFRPFDAGLRRQLVLWEVPLVAMDQTFRSYAQVPVAGVWEEVRPLLEQIRTHGGAGAILWHNTFFSGYKFAGYEKVYEQILSWVRESGGACTTAAQAVEWWRAR
jgi:peptidoglycan/xylan/chitin deacetylase (PgdA/CDA1 family)